MSKVIAMNVKGAETHGVTGTYYKLNKTQGIKVLNESCETIAEAKLSCDWEDAQAEAFAMRMAYKSGIVPKCYGVRIVRDTKSKQYFVGILMQDLGQTTILELMNNYTVSDQTYRKIERELYKKLLACGVQHGDLHEQNIMFHGGKYYAIDFGPNATETFKVTKKFSTVKKIDHKLKSGSNKISNLKAA